MIFRTEKLYIHLICLLLFVAGIYVMVTDSQYWIRGLLLAIMVVVFEIALIVFDWIMRPKEPRQEP